MLHRVRSGLIFLVVFAIGAAAGYHVLTGRPWMESFYWVVITLSSVGYTEHSTETPAVQAFSILVIVFGLMAVATTFGLLLQSLVEGEIRRTLGARRMTREIKQLSDHVIICGYGRIGRILAADFAVRSKPFVVLELDDATAAEAELSGYLVVVGDATDEEILINAGIERAATVVVALDSDANNVFLTLTARNLNRNLRIIARGEQPTTEKKLRQAGADQVVMPALIGAERIAHMVTHPHAAELFDLITDRSRLDADLEEIIIPPESPLAGKSIRSARPRDAHGVLILALRTADGLMQFNPDADSIVAPGDTAIVMGTTEDVQRFRNDYGAAE